MAIEGSKTVSVNPIKDLLFDPINPRLPAELQGATDQSRIFNHLYFEEGVSDVVSSIKENGFLPLDPLLVCKAEGRGKYYVLEGNRRLCAIKSLLDPEFRRESGEVLGKPLPSHVLSSLEKIKVVLVGDRNAPEVVAFLGYKHVSGARPWGPEEKARFVQQCVASKRYDVEVISRMLGVKSADINRPLSALRIIQQAKTWGVYDFFGNRKVKRAFGTLYTAFGYKGIRSYLGITPESILTEAPVPETNKEELGLALTWMFGDREKRVEPRLKDSRSLDDFDAVLASERAREVMVRSKSVEQAVRLTPRAKSTTRDQLRDIDFQLREMLGTIHEFRGDDALLEAAKDVTATAGEVVRTLDPAINPFVRLQASNEDTEEPS